MDTTTPRLIRADFITQITAIVPSHNEHQRSRFRHVRSVPTVRFHLENAMKKLNVHNRTQAAALAAQAGILGPLVQ